MIAKLTKKEKFGTRDMLYTFDCRGIASKARPGQFVEVRVSEGMEPFLRRPISIFDAAVLESYGDLKEAFPVAYSENRRELPVVLERLLDGPENIDMICTCGPNAMMKTVSDIAAKKKVPVQVSMEERMGCGIGPGGLGGSVTALGVNIETYATHIAGRLPVAVNICCHVNRHASALL